jgi:hypothetical protein
MVMISSSPARVEAPASNGWLRGRAGQMADPLHVPHIHGFIPLQPGKKRNADTRAAKV